MQGSHASALASLEYRLAFQDPSSAADIRAPIAGHVRDILAICRGGGVTRSAVKPVLQTLEELYLRSEREYGNNVSNETPPTRPPTRQCNYCDVPDSLIETDYTVVCTNCGTVADTLRIQDEAWLQPTSHEHRGTPKDASTLDATRTAASTRIIDQIDAAIRRLCNASHLAPLHHQKAMYLATLYVLDRSTTSSPNAALIAASSVIYSLLETWALYLVPVNIYQNQQWTTWWVLPPRALQPKGKK